MAKNKIRVAVVGATGYAGCELIKILLRHQEAEITSVSGKVDGPDKISNIYPVFKGQLELVCDNVNVRQVCGLADMIFLALPHRVSMMFAPEFLKEGKKVIDLSADYRLKDTAVYEKWYGTKHTSPDLIKTAVYGLPELYKDKIAGSAFIANPGCYPTGAVLGLAPLLAAKAIDPAQMIIDAKSGVTGAGRTPSLGLLFAETNENFKAYKINQHQHIPEIDQVLSEFAGTEVKVTFVPHLVPMNKGILSTIYTVPFKGSDTSGLIKEYRKFYEDAPFVRVLDEGAYPETKNVLGTNFCDIGIKVTGNRIIVITAIDNLYKGAASQAVQNMNLMMGFGEKTGLA